MTVDLTKMCEISNVVRGFYIVKILFKIVCILVPTILIIVTGIAVSYTHLTLPTILRV